MKQRYLIKKDTNRIPLFYLVTLIYWFSMYTTVPILAAYVEYLGASYKMAGLIVGMYGLIQMVIRLPLGIISDRLQKHKVFIVFGLMFSVLSGIGILVTQELTWILFLRVLAGAAAATWVDFTVLFTRYFAKEKTSKALGTLSSCSTLGQMLGILSGAWVAEHYTWEYSFLLGAFVGIIGFIGAFFIVEEKQDDSVEPINLTNVIKLCQNKTLLTVSFLSIVFQLLIFATVFGFTPVYAQSLAASKFDMGLLMFFSTFSTVIASWFGGTVLTQKFGEKKVLLIGLILISVFTIIIPFITSVSALIFTQAISGIGRGLVAPILLSLSIIHIHITHRSTAMGIYQSLYSFGMFLGPMFMGIIGDLFNLQQGFIILGLLGGLLVVLSHVLLRFKDLSYK